MAGGIQGPFVPQNTGGMQPNIQIFSTSGSFGGFDNVYQVLADVNHLLAAAQLPQPYNYQSLSSYSCQPWPGVTYIQIQPPVYQPVALSQRSVQPYPAIQHFYSAYPPPAQKPLGARTPYPVQHFNPQVSVQSYQHKVPGPPQPAAQEKPPLPPQQEIPKTPSSFNDIPAEPPPPYDEAVAQNKIPFESGTDGIYPELVDVEDANQEPVTGSGKTLELDDPDQPASKTEKQLLQEQYDKEDLSKQSLAKQKLPPAVPPKQKPISPQPAPVKSEPAEPQPQKSPPVVAPKPQRAPASNIPKPPPIPDSWKEKLASYLDHKTRQPETKPVQAETTASPVNSVQPVNTEPSVQPIPPPPPLPPIHSGGAGPANKATKSVKTLPEHQGTVEPEKPVKTSKQRARSNSSPPPLMFSDADLQKVGAGLKPVKRERSQSVKGGDRPSLAKGHPLGDALLDAMAKRRKSIADQQKRNINTNKKNDSPDDDSEW